MRARFAADPSTVGRTILVNNVSHTVMGVMPPGFFFPDVDARLSIASPCGVDETQMHGLGRLAPGVSLPQAQAELDTINQRAAEVNPRVKRVTGAFPIHQIVVGEFQRALWMLFAAVGVLLVLACANVAHLQLSRAVDRQMELAIRSAAGATRRRLIAQLLTEGAVLATASTLLGLLVGWVGLRLVQGLALTDIPRIEAARLDGRVLLVAAAACIVTALISGLWPAWKASHVHADETLRLGGGATAGAPRSQTQDLLAVTEVTLTAVLLVTAALVVRSFVETARAEWGFDSRNLLYVDVRLPGAIGRDPIASREWPQRAVDRLRQIPGVSTASHSTGVPIRWKAWWPKPIAIDGEMTSWMAGVWSVGAGYSATAGIPILQGRDFNRTDDGEAPRRVIVSREFADMAWPGAEPIGRTVQLLDVTREAAEDLQRRRAGDRAARLDRSKVEVTDGLSWQVIGVVENVRMFGLEVESNPAMYIVDAQWPTSMRQPTFTTQLLLRTSRRDLTMAARAKAALQELTGDLGFTEIAWMDDLVAQSVGGRGSNRLMLVTSAAFGVLALTFAAIGIYGMVALHVTQRLRELAIRAALGAERRQIVHAVLARVARLLVGGLVLGLVAALALTRGMAPLLFRVQPADPASYALAVLSLSVAACVACMVPLRRALRFDVELLKE